MELAWCLFCQRLLQAWRMCIANVLSGNKAAKWACCMCGICLNRCLRIGKSMARACWFVMPHQAMRAISDFFLRGVLGGHHQLRQRELHLC